MHRCLNPSARLLFTLPNVCPSTAPLQLEANQYFEQSAPVLGTFLERTDSHTVRIF